MPVEIFCSPVPPSISHVPIKPLTREMADMAAVPRHVRCHQRIQAEVLSFRSSENTKWESYKGYGEDLTALN